MYHAAANIIVHQRPERATNPVTKGRDFYSILGAGIAFPFSIIGAIIAMYIAEAMFKSKKN